MYWKRSAPYASFRLFDAPARELCTVSRARTNTPLQALALLNDPVYVEAARAFAARILTEGGKGDVARLRFALRLSVARPPRPGELEVLRSLLDTERARFGAAPRKAQALSRIGDFRPPAQLDATELAAWTILTNAQLNTGEVITRP